MLKCTGSQFKTGQYHLSQVERVKSFEQKGVVRSQLSGSTAEGQSGTRLVLRH